ncbi:MAG: hypothetical protein EBR82_26500 [Caulobacteraceae bacterium]|nr:hypothetical protein [Caulobacteraceae bacterium]
MTWAGEMRANAVAWRLARRLPQFLRKGWGGSEVYTVGQIEAGLAALNVKGPYRTIGYAAYLTEPDFDAVTEGLSPISYEAARRKFFGLVPWSGPGPYAFSPISNADAANQGSSQTPP